MLIFATILPGQPDDSYFREKETGDQEIEQSFFFFSFFFWDSYVSLCRPSWSELPASVSLQSTGIRGLCHQAQPYAQFFTHGLNSGPRICLTAELWPQPERGMIIMKPSSLSSVSEQLRKSAYMTQSINKCNRRSLRPGLVIYKLNSTLIYEKKLINFGW